MARRVFFSFHHQGDIWRVNQIRQSRVTKDWEPSDFLDAASWEKVKRTGEDAVKAWIDREISGTGVTVVLIGSRTAERRFVRYEIEESYKKGNGILGIYIHRMKNQQRKRTQKGRNPLDDVQVQVDEPYLVFFSQKQTKRLSEIYATYDWVTDDGYNNIGRWVEEAAKKAGR